MPTELWSKTNLNFMLQKKNTTEKECKLFTASVTDLDDEGRGIAIVDGRDIFIDGALAGEQVSFYYLRKRQRQLRGRVVEITRESPERVPPVCTHAGTCGGCRLQHLNYAAQIKLKTRTLKARFSDYADVNPQQWLPALTGNPLGYRRRARLSVRYYTRDDETRVGFRSRFGGYVIALEHCPVLEERVAELIPALQVMISNMSCRDRIPQIEVSLGDSELAIIVRHLVPLTASDENLLSAFGQKHKLSIYLQAKGPDTCFCLYPDSESRLSYHVPEYNIEIFFTPADFIQVNTELNRQMIRQAMDMLDPQTDDVILDLFCGLGNFSLPMAGKSACVIGVDFSESLIQCASLNAQHNRSNNAQFIQANLADEASGEFWKRFQPDKVILDPSRSGALEIIRQIPENGPQKIVYISCNPETLARDAACLVNDKGYTLTHAGIIDMFPHTKHIESMLVFSLK